MRLFSIALAGLLAAGPALAQSHPLQGTWVVRMPSGPKYIAIVLVDREGRATYESPKDSGRPARFIGYVAHMEGADVQFRLTDKSVVAHMDCALESTEFLSCQITRKVDNGTSAPFALVRVSDGPAKL